MSKLVIARNVCDIYADDSRTELISQAIMGQTVNRMNESADRVQVTTSDTYSGHLRKHQVAVATAPWGKEHEKQVAALFAPVHVRPNATSQLITTLVISTIVCVEKYRQSRHSTYARIRMPDGSRGYVNAAHLMQPVKVLNKSLTDKAAMRAMNKATRTALKLVGTPYLWGGCTSFGIDCSGFVQLCYGMAGIQLLRDAYMQFDDARFEPVQKATALDADAFTTGDLVFFGTAFDGRTKVTHVGMILPDGRMIHSAGGFGVVVESRNGHRLASTFLGARRLKSQTNLALTCARPA